MTQEEIIKRIERYIENTAPISNYYDASAEEIAAILCLKQRNKGFDAVSLAFDYGRAKGYRQAMKEMKGAKTA